MANRIDKGDWKEFIDKFDSYKGTVTQYCIDNNLSKSQFYYHKRRFENLNKSTFHAISFEDSRDVRVDNKSTDLRDIKIEIGKANIFISANEIAVYQILLRN